MLMIGVAACVESTARDAFFNDCYVATVEKGDSMNKADIPFLSAAELSGLIRSKEVSPVEAAEAYLDRIDDVDFRFNAYLTVCRSDALRSAREAEQAIARGDYLGPMHGIPVAVKDQMWSKGVRSTGGSRILADFVPEEDATALANLKRAGAVLLGKHNMTEFAITAFSHRFRIPHNPWDLDFSPGGSSSGSGAGTAAFLCATSIGEDTGGSLRRPSAWSGLVGMKPGWGRVSRYGVMPGVWSMDTLGPISRRVEDAAITLGAIAGYDPKDPYTWNTPVPDYANALDGNIGGMRVGVIAEEIRSEAADPEVSAAVVAATKVLGELGASVEEVSLPLTRHMTDISGLLIRVESSAYHRRSIRERLQDYGHDNQIGLLTGSIVPAQVYYKAQKLRTLLRNQVLKALEQYDVLALPTSAQTAPRIQESDRIITDKESAEQLPFMRTSAFNLASTPAISVPCGFSAAGLPIGLQITGRPGAEETVLKVAHAYEQATPWHTMRPPHA